MKNSKYESESSNGNQVSFSRWVIRANIISVVVVGFFLAMMVLIFFNLLSKKNYKKIAWASSAHTVSMLDQINDGEYRFDEETGKIYKGDYEITDKAFWTVHEEDTDMQHTIFWGDTRVLSDIKDKNGNSVVGTKLTDKKILNIVNNDGYYSENKVTIAGVKYTVCYYPLKNGNNVVGMMFTGVKETATTKLIYQYYAILIVLTIILALVIVLIVVKLSLKKIVLFGHNLNEIAKITDEKKKGVIELGEMTNDNMGQIDTAIEQVAAAVNDQAENTEGIMNNMQAFGSSLDIIVNNLKQTSDSASGSIILINELKEKLNNLEKASAANSSEIMELSKEVQESRETVSSINTIIEKINDIAMQVTILSFNASIEAVRAGDTGKGFAVVANSIKELSDKTKESLEDIIVTVEAVNEKMNETAEASNALIERNNGVVNALAETTDRMGVVEQSFHQIVQNIDAINKESAAVIYGKDEVIRTVSSLAAASEQNAAMSEEIKATSDEVISITNNLLTEIDKLNEISRIIDMVKKSFSDKY